MRSNNCSPETALIVDEIVFQASLLALRAALELPESPPRPAPDPLTARPGANSMESAGLDALASSLAAASSLPVTAGVIERRPS